MSTADIFNNLNEIVFKITKFGQRSKIYCFCWAFRLRNAVFGERQPKWLSQIEWCTETWYPWILPFSRLEPLLSVARCLAREEVKARWGHLHKSLCDLVTVWKVHITCIEYWCTSHSAGWCLGFMCLAWDQSRFRVQAKYKRNLLPNVMTCNSESEHVSQSACPIPHCCVIGYWFW